MPPLSMASRVMKVPMKVVNAEVFLCQCLHCPVPMCPGEGANDTIWVAMCHWRRKTWHIHFNTKFWHKIGLMYLPATEKNLREIWQLNEIWSIYLPKIGFGKGWQVCLVFVLIRCCVFSFTFCSILHGLIYKTGTFTQVNPTFIKVALLYWFET